MFTHMIRSDFVFPTHQKKSTHILFTNQIILNGLNLIILNGLNLIGDGRTWLNQNRSWLGWDRNLLHWQPYLEQQASISLHHLFKHDSWFRLIFSCTKALNVHSVCYIAYSWPLFPIDRHSISYKRNFAKHEIGTIMQPSEF